MDIIGLDRVFVRRDGQDILKNITWNVGGAEHWFIMGSNGCGKTTLMEMLAGYVWPSRGKVSVLGGTFGRTSIPELRTRVGFVSPWIFRRMAAETTVEEVVASGFEGAVGFYGQRTAAVKKAVLRQLRFFRLTLLSRRKFGTLSSGEQLKTVLARALVHAPAILVLDEPFSLLDIGARLEMYVLLARLARAPKAPRMLLVTHHREDIRPFFTHGLLMRRGRIVASGPRQEVLKPGILAKAFGVDINQAKEFLRA